MYRPGFHAVVMRAIWTGYVSFGLVSLPVRLYSATEEHGTGFDRVHARDGSGIRHRRVCESEGVEVPQSEIARGCERPDGRTVALLGEDLAALPPTKRTVEVLGFIDAGDVDPVLYSRPYWVGAAGEQGQRPYALRLRPWHGTTAWRSPRSPCAPGCGWQC